jgi:hypothetical protein
MLIQEFLIAHSDGKKQQSHLLRITFDSY